MKSRPYVAILASILLPLTFASKAQSQGVAIFSGLVEGTTGGITTSLTGYALTAIGLNSQAATQTAILSQLTQINDELDTISDQLTEIQDAIQTQTCAELLSSSAVTEALSSIATVSNTYTELVMAGEDPNGTVSQAEIDDFLDQVANGPAGGESIALALTTINNALQGVNNNGIIGSCEAAVSSVPGIGSFAADRTFYSDPINLLQYFGDYQVIAALLLAEYNNYLAFEVSPYFTATGNMLPANEAALVCSNPTGQTATYCGLARDALEQVYVYLQNQYSADGVPYSTSDSSGNLQTGLYIASDSADYLFATSLEEFTNFEDIPQNNCPSVMTSSSPCGLTFSNDPTNNNNPSGSPFWSTLFDSTYQYETGWAPATAMMWRSVLDAWTSGSSSQTLAEGLTNLGFQNATNKVIMTQTEYSAKVTTTDANGGAVGLTPFSATAVCFLDTNIDRSFSHQPWCYNGSLDGVDYGESGDLIQNAGGYNDGKCLIFSSSSIILSKTNDPDFYCSNCQYDSQLGNATGESDPAECPAGSWVDGSEPSWIVQANGQLTLGGYFWPALDISDPTCGTNLSFGALQPALERSPTNFLEVPTMCGTDFDNYFSGVAAPRNPYQQVVFTSDAVSGAGSTAATLGPITIQLQNTSSGTAVPLTATSATTVSLSSSSLTGIFALSANGATISNLTIPAGSSTATFYYGDSTAGTPQIIADPGTMVPGTQTETITSGSTVSQATVGTTSNAGSTQANGTSQITIVADPGTTTASTQTQTTTSGSNVSRAMAGNTLNAAKTNGSAGFPASNSIQIQQAQLTISHLLYEDSGAGELVHQQNGAGITLPIVLTALPNSTAVDSVYATASGVTPRIRAEVINPLGTRKLQLLIDLARINSPKNCSGNPSTTRLHTQASVGDGSSRPISFDVDTNWQCYSNGARLAVSSSTVAGMGVVSAQTSTAKGQPGQSVAAGSFVLANTGLTPINVSSVAINVSNPAMFSALTLSATGATAVSQPPAASTVFNFAPAVRVGAGQSQMFNLSGTLSTRSTMVAMIGTGALNRSRWKNGQWPGLLIGVVGFGLMLIPFADRRNRTLLIMVGILAIAASMPACDSNPGTVQPTSIQSMSAGSISTAGVPIGGLPVTLSVVTKQ